MGTARARRDLSASQERLGDIYRKRKQLDLAEAQYMNARSLREALNDAIGDAGTQRDLSAILTKLGDIKRARRDLDGAAKDYGAALALDRVLSQELRTWQARDDYAISLAKYGDVQRTLGKTREAMELQREAVEVFDKNVDETGSPQYRKHLAAGLEKLAKSWDSLWQREQAEVCYERAVHLRRDLMHEYPSHTTRHELATTLFLYADFARDADRMREALRLWEEMCHEHPEYMRYADSAKKMLMRLS